MASSKKQVPEVSVREIMRLFEQATPEMRKAIIIGVTLALEMGPVKEKTE